MFLRSSGRRGRRRSILTTVFVIRMADGEEIQFSGSDRLTVSDAGLITVQRSERHGDVITYYSPIAWRSVTQRVKRGVDQVAPPTGPRP